MSSFTIKQGDKRLIPLGNRLTLPSLNCMSVASSVKGIGMKPRRHHLRLIGLVS